MSFPAYCRSRLRSQTYLTLVRIFSHLPGTPDNGGARMEQEKPEKGPEFSEFVGSASVDPKDPIPKKIRQEVHETTEGDGDKGGELGTKDVVLCDIERMLGIEEVEDPLRRKLEDMPMQTNDFNEQQRIMDDLEHAVEGIEDLCDGGLVSFNSGLGEKQDDNNEVELMDYQVEHVEFQHNDVNKSGLQVPGELTTTKEGELRKEEQCCPKVAEALPVSLDTTTEALNVSEEGVVSKEGRLLDFAILGDKLARQNEEKVQKSICASNASNSSNILIEKGDMEEGELASNSSSILIEKGGIEEGELAGDFGMEGDYDFVPKPRNNANKQIGSKGVTNVPANYARNQVSYIGLWEDANKDHENSSASKEKIDLSKRKRRGLASEERKAKRKQKKRKNRAEKNRQLGVKRLKLPPMQKSKAIAYCRHYLVGRCHEGDKCKFSHDTVPLTKSTPCSHFARQSCMKGDDCLFDHELSKYPCNNFATKGFCSRGDTCLFSHQLLAKKDSPTLSKVCRPDLKSALLSGNTSFSMPPNSCGSSVQQNHLISSMGICSPINLEDKVTDTIKKQLTPAPKGISFINITKSSLPRPSAPNQSMITPPNKENLVQIGAWADQSASGTNQTLVEIPKKLPAIAPQRANFLSFGKTTVCKFGGSISSLFSKENCIKVPQFVNFGFPNNGSSSIKKVDCSKAIDGTNQSVPKTDPVTHEIFEKNKSMAEGIKSSFPGKAWTNDAPSDLQGSSSSHVDQSRGKSVQKAKKASNNSQTSTATSCMLLVSGFGLQRSLEGLPFRNDEHASYSSQRALMSTLGFALEHESDIRIDKDILELS